MSESSSDEILDALGMTEDLGSKIDCVLTQIAEMDKKVEKISSSVSILEKKFDKLDARVNKLEANQSEARGKVKELENGLNELTKQVNERNAANEKVEVNCERRHVKRGIKLSKINYYTPKFTLGVKICASTKFKKKANRKIHAAS